MSPLPRICNWIQLDQIRSLSKLGQTSWIPKQSGSGHQPLSAARHTFPVFPDGVLPLLKTLKSLDKTILKLLLGVLRDSVS